MSVLLALAGSVPVAHAQESQEPTSADAPVALSEVTVRERRDRGYQVMGATSATKVETAIVDTPVCVKALKPLDRRSPLFYYQAQSSNALAGKPGEGFTS